uniref:Uncharacterized protein n=1 Tax=Rhizophagus irregularis (strain DAOM 181602 / DAOM 197198 / MUCL 43194) TaxID=747089 RepID=U9T779_RHIID
MCHVAKDWTCMNIYQSFLMTFQTTLWVGLPLELVRRIFEECVDHISLEPSRYRMIFISIHIQTHTRCFRSANLLRTQRHLTDREITEGIPVTSSWRAFPLINKYDETIIYLLVTSPIP